MDIPETYASPNMRHALFLQDHPAAPQPEFWEGPGTDAGVPESAGGSKPHCVCKLSYGSAEGLEPVFGAKQLKGAVKDSDDWEKECTKALGRALKRAGYPDDINDLRARLAYATALAKNEAIREGAATSTEDASKVIAAAATTPEVAEAEREGPAAPKERNVSAPQTQAPTPVPDPEPEEVEQPELSTQTERRWSPQDIDDLREQLNSLTDEEKDTFRNFLAEQEIKGKAPDWSDDNLDAVDAWLRS